jgi:hypothetical protein
MQLGDTFVMGAGGHLWIVISDPALHASEYIIVNITTDVERAGKDCQLNVGDHPFITEKSYVTYGDARKVTPAQDALFMKHIAAGDVTRHASMRAAILHKIISAGKATTAMAPIFKALL